MADISITPAQLDAEAEKLSGFLKESNSGLGGELKGAAGILREDLRFLTPRPDLGHQLIDDINQQLKGSDTSVILDPKGNAVLGNVFIVKGNDKIEAGYLPPQQQ